MSGHSKWSTIKHKKGALDQKRGTLFTKLSREITIAAKSGDPNPDMNFRLRLAVDNAKSQNMPKDNIERAIARATGGAGSESLFEITYEVYGPGGTGIIVEALTNNKNRSVSAIRSIVNRAGGNMANSGSVSWNFSKMGQIIVKVGEGADAEEIALEIMDQGAEDVNVDEDTISVQVAYDKLAAMRDAASKIEHVDLESAELILAPNSMVDLDESTARQTLRLLDNLEELEDVQRVFSNANFPETVLEEAVNS